MHTVVARDWAEGGTIAVVVEPACDECAAITVHWPWQGILAGEAQFGLLMRVIFNNLAEHGFDLPIPQWEWQADPTQPPAKPLPPSLALPADQALRVLVNVALGQTFFCAEAVGQPCAAARSAQSAGSRHAVTSAGDSAGCGQLLACAMLTNAKVQYKMTTGVCDKQVHFLGS